MATTSLSLVADALKNEYLGALREQLNRKADPLLAQLEGDTTMVNTGGNIVMALRYGRVGGIAALASDTSDLPTANGRKTKQITFDTRNLFAQISISDKVIESTSNDIGAFANLLTTEIEDAQTDAKDDLSRQVYGDGTGLLSLCAAVVGANTFGVDTTYVAEGMLIDIVHTNGTVFETGREITAVDEAGATITISGAAVTTLVTDYITRSGSKGNELTGLGKICTDNNTLYGQDRNVQKWMNAQHIPVDGEIDDLPIQQGIDLADTRTGAAINYISCSKGVARAWQRYQLSYKQNPQYLELKGGFKVMAYVSPSGEVAISGTKYAPKNKMRLLDLTHFMMPQIKDWSWMDGDGAMLSRHATKPIYQATLRKYGDLVTDLPRGVVELTGITEH